MNDFCQSCANIDHLQPAVLRLTDASLREKKGLRSSRDGNDRRRGEKSLPVWIRATIKRKEVRSQKNGTKNKQTGGGMGEDVFFLCEDSYRITLVR